MRRLTKEEFIEKAIAVHGDRYDYSQCEFTTTRDKVTIICKKHGPFIQNACSHLMGSGCKICGNLDKWNGEAGIALRKKIYTPERQLHMEETCMSKYGAKTYALSEEGHARICEIKQDPEFRARMSELISSDAVQSRTKATCQERYGTDNYMQTEVGRKLMHDIMTQDGMMDRIIAAKKAHGTLTSSKAEIMLYELLCQQFGADNVKSQYKSDVYPFWSDFYLPQFDLYVEYNLHWTHGKHFFDDTSAEDMARVEEWRSRHTKFFDGAVLTWCYYDVLKRNIARENDLNYVVFWLPKLKDAKEWISDGCPIRKDWM